MSEDEIAQAMALRNRGRSWRRIGQALHRDHRWVRDALVARGYPGRKTPAQAAMGLIRRQGGHWHWTSTYHTCPVYRWYERGVVSRQVSARRLLYEATYGPLPPGVLVYGGCGIRACVNPACATTTAPRRGPRPDWGRALRSSDVRAARAEVAS